MEDVLTPRWDDRGSGEVMTAVRDRCVLGEEDKAGEWRTSRALTTVDGLDLRPTSSRQCYKVEHAAGAYPCTCRKKFHLFQANDTCTELR